MTVVPGLSRILTLDVVSFICFIPLLASLSCKDRWTPVESRFLLRYLLCVSDQPLLHSSDLSIIPPLQEHRQTVVSACQVSVG